MKNIVVEQSIKYQDKWRVITRSLVSGRVLKVWFDGVELSKAELLAEGIRRSIKWDTANEFKAFIKKQLQ